MAVRITDEEFMAIGLEAAGYKRWGRCKPKTNLRNFRAHYGCCPKSCENMWMDLQLSPNQECRIEPNANPKLLLLGIRFLWRYETEKELCSRFDMSEPTVRKWKSLYARKIQLLLKPKTDAAWAELEQEDVINVVTLDGTHAPQQEPRPWSTKWSSHKLGKSAGLNYEVGLSLRKPQLAWVYGPTPPGECNDLGVFRQKLKGEMAAKLPGKKAFADSIYSPETEFISTRNKFDTWQVAELKNRALSRHESFNAKLKNFTCLNTKFRHGIENHKIAFEAVCAIVTYEIECGAMSLFEV